MFIIYFSTIVSLDLIRERARAVRVGKPIEVAKRTSQPYYGISLPRYHTISFSFHTLALQLFSTWRWLMCVYGKALASWLGAQYAPRHFSTPVLSFSLSLFLLLRARYHMYTNRDVDVWTIEMDECVILLSLCILYMRCYIRLFALAWHLPTRAQWMRWVECYAGCFFVVAPDEFIPNTHTHSHTHFFLSLSQCPVFSCVLNAHILCTNRTLLCYMCRLNGLLYYTMLCVMLYNTVMPLLTQLLPWVMCTEEMMTVECVNFIYELFLLSGVTP